MSKPLIAIENLTISYGRFVAVHLDALKIERKRSVIGLFGPNGAGKSTLLRTITGDIATYSGHLEAPERKSTAYLPDEAFLYPWLTVKQCKELFVSRYPDFRGEVFEEFLVGSQIKESSRVSDLSKGMGERLHLALIMSRDPELYVLDEPLAAVDPLVREHLLDLIQRYQSAEAPLLLSTHLINSVDQIFDEIILISEGSLVAYDSVEALRERGDGDLELAYKRSLRNHV